MALRFAIVRTVDDVIWANGWFPRTCRTLFSRFSSIVSRATVVIDPTFFHSIEDTRRYLFLSKSNRFVLSDNPEDGVAYAPAISLEKVMHYASYKIVWLVGGADFLMKFAEHVDEAHVIRIATEARHDEGAIVDHRMRTYITANMERVRSNKTQTLNSIFFTEVFVPRVRAKKEGEV